MTLQDHWNMFERSVIPPNATTVQRQEMKKAFIAGMSTMMSVLEHTPDDGDEEFVFNLCTELDQLCSDFLGVNHA